MIDERLAVWALSKIEGLGPAGLKLLLDKFGTASAVLNATANEIVSSEVASMNLAQKICVPRNWDDTMRKFEASIPADTNFAAITESNYPAKLKNIADAPPYLYFRGNLQIFDNPTLAVVGSRQPTDYGRRITSRLVSELASAGIVIISGLAYGIDGVAHQTVLEVGGITAAVFGCGLDMVYPSGHKAMAQRIAQSGCLISEFPKGTKPERFNFPIRNRIVAGLSDGVLVVEAGSKSGALVTASIALDQGRDVLAVPGSLDNELSVGPNSLIKQGAVAVTGIDDIFANFGWHKPSEIKEKTYDLGKLSVDEASVFNLLSVQPVHLDEIGRKVNLGPGKTAEALLNLELKGFILRKPGNFVVRL